MRLATVVPNAPGNAGVFQFACVEVLELFDMNKNDAKLFSLILWGATTLPLLIGGAIATAQSGFNLGELRDRAKKSVNAVQKVK